jgi:hypothetical protein
MNDLEKPLGTYLNPKFLGQRFLLLRIQLKNHQQHLAV